MAINAKMSRLAELVPFCLLALVPTVSAAALTVGTSASRQKGTSSASLDIFAFIAIDLGTLRYCALIALDAPFLATLEEARRCCAAYAIEGYQVHRFNGQHPPHTTRKPCRRPLSPCGVWPISVAGRPHHHRS